MKKLVFLSCILIFASPSYAEQTQSQTVQEQSYGEKVEEKALNGFVNMTTAPLEIPKSMINESNKSNIAFGVIGGAAKGILNTVGRFASGVADLFTAFIPTQPVVYPRYVWDDFDADTSYGKAFRLDNQSVAGEAVDNEPRSNGKN